MTYEQFLEERAKYDQVQGQVYRIKGNANDNKQFRLLGKTTDEFDRWKWEVEYDTGNKGAWFPQTVFDKAEYMHSTLACWEERKANLAAKIAKPRMSDDAIKRAHDYGKKLLDEWSTTKLFGVDPSDIGTCSNADDQKPTTFTMDDLNKLKETMKRHDDVRDAFAMQLGCMYGRSPKNLYNTESALWKTANYAGLYGIGDNFNPFAMSNFNKQEKETMITFNKYEVVEINGRDAKDMSDELILGIMEDLQRQIDDAKSVKVQSKTNEKRIDTMTGTLFSIVEYLDGRNDDEE